MLMLLIIHEYKFSLVDFDKRYFAAFIVMSAESSGCNLWNEETRSRVISAYITPAKITVR